MKNYKFLKIVVQKAENFSQSNYLTLLPCYGKTTHPRMFFKAFIGVYRYQVLFETMFGLILEKNWAVEAQKVF